MEPNPNAAATFFGPSMVNVHVGLAPVQAPAQPLKERLEVLAVRVTVVPLVRIAPQVGPQVMPPKSEVTRPVPGPEENSVNTPRPYVGVDPPVLNVAHTFRA